MKVVTRIAALLGLFALFVCWFRAPAHAQRHEITAAENKLTEEESLAIEALNRKDYQKAIRFASSAIQRSPKNENLYYYRGRAYYSINKLALARADLGRAIELAPSNPKYYESRAQAWCHNAINDFSHCPKANVQNAIKDMQKATELKPANAWYWIVLGEAFKALGDYKNAKASYESGVRLGDDEVWRANAAAEIDRLERSQKSNR